MNQSDIHLLDLPNEILIIILKKLDNIDVLYSLFGINNERLDILVQDDVFINILNFVKTSFIDSKLDRFCTAILPQKHHCVKKLILETTSLERILLAGNYPNLTSLELFNFRQETVSRYFTSNHLTCSSSSQDQNAKAFHYFISFWFRLDDSIFQHIFKHQIKDLILHNNDEYDIETSLNTYTKHVYLYTMVFFKNLKHLTIVSSSVNEYPPLSLWDLQQKISFYSNLTELRLNVSFFYDCLCLLDGRLKQLTTFIVQVDYISPKLFMSPKMVS
ncbi:unnamed protein product [Rotaria sordida]|uniref:F-box domain-containing protein n=1 Tax=Rotaria sordida TaxID=392033 RepID=A0A813WG02_9BILA|nr:unnamed protein product [Rotaria sordida]CAF3820524.1 unnamed protein product [Rotaria sordida]